MKKKIKSVEKSGSWIVCLILMIFPPIGILYWLIKIRKKKTYEYVESK